GTRTISRVSRVGGSMGRRGPAPTPTEVLRLRGSWSRKTPRPERYNVTGHITLRFTNLAGSATNAVLSGLTGRPSHRSGLIVQPASLALGESISELGGVWSPVQWLLALGPPAGGGARRDWLSSIQGY